MPMGNIEGLNDKLENQWEVGLLTSPCSEPLAFCCACVCVCPAAYMQRETLLQMTGEPYYCCAGMFPCGPLGQPCAKEPCLCLEACCCPWCALTGNRFLIQSRFAIQDGACDECILWFTCCISWTICIAQLAGVDVPREVEMSVDLLQTVVMGCMYAQQHRQIQVVKERGYAIPDNMILELLPPLQQQMIAEGKPPSSAAQGRPVDGGGGGMKPPGQQGMRTRE